VVVTALFFVLCVWLVVRSQRRKVVTGHQAMVGATGRVVEAIPAGQTGKVVFHGEVWSASSEASIEKDETIEVTAIEGRIAHVRKALPEGG
jgi:membrane-bound serine protease (ClpP class)